MSQKKKAPFANAMPVLEKTASEKIEEEPPLIIPLRPPGNNDKIDFHHPSLCVSVCVPSNAKAVGCITASPQAGRAIIYSMVGWLGRRVERGEREVISGPPLARSCLMN